MADGKLQPVFTLVSCSAYLTLKMKAICSSETSVDFQRITWRYIFKRHLATTYKVADLRHARSSRNYAYIKTAEQERVSEDQQRESTTLASPRSTGKFTAQRPAGNHRASAQRRQPTLAQSSPLRHEIRSASIRRARSQTYRPCQGHDLTDYLKHCFPAHLYILTAINICVEEYRVQTAEYQWRYPERPWASAVLRRTATRVVRPSRGTVYLGRHQQRAD
jgi:hypothetical protein